MKLWSPAFANGRPIPSVYARTGGDGAKNLSPPLEWSGVPAADDHRTQSLALIVEDPDAPDPANPKMTPWVHWVLYNIPPTVTRLEEGAGGSNSNIGGTAAHNDWMRARYDGPDPPTGSHRYFFKLYALDTMLDEHQVTDRASFGNAAEGHIVRLAEWVGTYEKQP